MLTSYSRFAIDTSTMTKPEIRQRTTVLIQSITDQLDEGEGRISLNHFMARLTDRAFGVGILVFALPNALPLGIPGISSICAVPIILLAGHMLLGFHRVWLPPWLGRKTFSEHALKRILLKSLPYLRGLEKIFKPRATYMTTGVWERLAGLLIIILASIMFLPIPFGNSVPAICMCIMALGIMERDGSFVIAGMVVSLVVTVLMSTVIFKILQAVWQFFSVYIA